MLTTLSLLHLLFRLNMHSLLKSCTVVLCLVFSHPIHNYCLSVCMVLKVVTCTIMYSQYLKIMPAQSFTCSLVLSEPSPCYVHETQRHCVAKTVLRVLFMHVVVFGSCFVESSVCMMNDLAAFTSVLFCLCGNGPSLWCCAALLEQD